MTVRARAVVALVATTLLAACFESDAAQQGLNKATAANIILAYENSNCIMNHAYYMSGPKAQQARSLIRDMINSSTLRPGNSNAGQFAYLESDGRLNTVAVQDGGYDVTIQECMLVPTQVEVLDTTIDQTGKIAQVIYRHLNPRPSDLAKKLQVLGKPDLLAENGGGGVSDTGYILVHNPGQADRVIVYPGEATATLRRLDATGWRVENIR